jgi:hypothetical protein
MRKALPIMIAVILAGVGFGAFGGGPPEPTAGKKVTSIPVENAISAYGLYVVLPSEMTNFPKELVPLP